MLATLPYHSLKQLLPLSHCFTTVCSVHNHLCLHVKFKTERAVNVKQTAKLRSFRKLLDGSRSVYQACIYWCGEGGGCDLLQLDQTLDPMVQLSSWHRSFPQAQKIQSAKHFGLLLTSMDVRGSWNHKTLGPRKTAPLFMSINSRIFSTIFFLLCSKAV